MALISLKQAAEIVGLDRQTILNWAHKGYVPFKKVNGVYYVEEETFNNIIADLKEAGNRLAHLEDLKKVISDEINALTEERNLRRLERTVNKVWLDSLKNGFFLMVLNILKEIKSVKSREYDIIEKLIKGEDIDKLSEEYGISRAAIRQAIYFTVKKASNITTLKNILHDYMNVSNALDGQLELVKELKAENEKLRERLALFDKVKTTDANEIEAIHKDRFLNSKLTEFGISAGTLNCFRYADIETVRDLCRWRAEDLLRLRGFGKRRLIEVEDFLEEYNLRLGMSVDELAKYITKK